MPRVVMVVAFGMLLGLVGLDLALAAVRGQDELHNALHVEDERTLWRTAPNFRDEWVSTDSYGLRNPGLSRTADKRELRVLTLGDSRVFGARNEGPTDEETWQVQLEGQLRTHAREGLRVLNGGVGGYSTMQACQHGLRLIEVIQPDLVLLVVSPGGRCLIDSSSAYANVLIGGQLVPRDLASRVPHRFMKPVMAAHRWLSDHSSLYAHYRAFVGELDGGLGALRESFMYCGDAEMRHDVAYFVERTFRAIDELNHAIERNHARLVVVVLHEYAGTNDARWSSFVAAHVGSVGPRLGTPRQKPIEALQERLRRNRIASWSILEFQQRISDDRQKYFAGRGQDQEHLSAIGSQLLAIELARQFESSGILRVLSKSRAEHPRR